MRKTAAAWYGADIKIAAEIFHPLRDGVADQRILPWREKMGIGNLGKMW